jgi:DNA-binding MarR family transcriptional regulator
MTKKPRAPGSGEGRYSYEGLDRVIHERARLGILTSLVTHPEGLLFKELRDLCALTDGNLSRHIETLEEAKLVEVWKSFRDRKPQTLCRLSAQGREAFAAYLTELERVVRDAAQAMGEAPAERNPKGRPAEGRRKGWAPA